MGVMYMEVIEYLGKYNLENTEHFPYNNFVDDLKKDFDDLVREFDAMQDMSTYRFCINSLRAKWEKISENSFRPLPECLWKSLYKTHIVVLREEVKNYDPEMVEGQKKNMQKKGKSYGN